MFQTTNQNTIQPRPFVHGTCSGARTHEMGVLCCDLGERLGNDCSDRGGWGIYG